MPSVYGNILTSVKTLVASVSGLTTSGQVVIRKRLAFLRATDTTFPFVCISPTVERLADSYMPNKDILEYPVQIAIVRESALSLIDYDTVLLLREQIRQKLRTPTLASASSVWNVVGYDPSPAFSMEGFDSALDVSAMEFVYSSVEVRNQ